MKEGWTYKKLGEVATFARGLTYSKNDEVESSDNIVLRSNNIDLISGKLDLTELKFLKTGFIIPEDKRLKRGSLFICMSNGSKAHLGKVAYIDKNYNYAFGGFMGQITPNEDVAGQYLHYALCSPEYKRYIKSLSEGANINNLKYKDLELFTIPVPPLSEQHRIVSRLDSAFAHIDELKANAEKQLSEARTLFQKALTKAMEPKEGWEEKKVKDLSLLITKGSSPKWQGNSYVNSGGILFVTSENVREGCLEFNPAKYVDSSFNIKQRRSILKKNDVLVNIVGASIGRAAIFDIDTENANINQAVCLVRLDSNKMLPQYLCLFLNSEHAFNQYASMVKDTARANLSLENIGCLEIGVPPISEQQRIVSRLDSLSAHIRELEEVTQKTIAECDALKQALLRKVFE